MVGSLQDVEPLPARLASLDLAVGICERRIEGGRDAERRGQLGDVPRTGGDAVGSVLEGEGGDAQAGHTHIDVLVGPGRRPTRSPRLSRRGSSGRGPGTRAGSATRHSPSHRPATDTARRRCWWSPAGALPEATRRPRSACLRPHPPERLPPRPHRLRRQPPLRHPPRPGSVRRGRRPRRTHRVPRPRARVSDGTGASTLRLGPVGGLLVGPRSLREKIPTRRALRERVMFRSPRGSATFGRPQLLGFPAAGLGK